MAIDINKIRDEKLTEDEKMEMIANYFDAQKSVPEDIRIYIPDSGYGGHGTFTPSIEDYEAIKQIIIYNIYDGGLPPASGTASAGPFLIKGKNPQVSLVYAREFDDENPDKLGWGGVSNATAYEYSWGEIEALYLVFLTNWESTGADGYIVVSLAKEGDTLTGVWYSYTS